MSTTEQTNESGTSRPRRRRGGRNRNNNNYNRNRNRNRSGQGGRGPRQKKKEEPKGIVGRFLAWLFPGSAEKPKPKADRERPPREKRERRPRREKRFEDSPASDASSSIESKESTEAPRERKPRTPEAYEIITPRLYVGNLSYECVESDLFDLFSQHGQVSNCEVVFGRSGRSKGFGFVELGHLDTAKTASEALHQTDFQRRQIIVSGAKDKN